MAVKQVPFKDIPKAHYGAILADPPWRFETWSDKGRDRSPDRHYRTISYPEIGFFDVGSLAKKDCVLFLWVTWPMLLDGIHLIERWGFKYKTCAFAWMKTDSAQNVWAGTGYWTRANSEVCLLATRGHPKRLKADVRQGIIAPRREHSRKPDEIHGRIQRLVAGPYLELFARQPRSGWTTWGNQVNRFVEVA
jgi:N6-adenosine-specific RNA methylase IME4